MDRLKRIRLPMILLLAVALIYAGCAATPKGKAQQGSQVVVQLGEAILKGCTESKAKGWKPLSLDVCTKLTASYDIAWKASKDALDVTADPSKQVPIALLTIITDFVLYAYDVLTAAKIVVPTSATAFVKQTQAAALK